MVGNKKRRPRKKNIRKWYSLAIVEDGFANFDGKTCCTIEAIVSGISGRTGVCLERDVGSYGR